MSQAIEARQRLPSAATWDRLSLWLAGGSMLVALGLCFAAGQDLRYIWRSSQFYGHAYAIPLVAAYLAYGARTKVLSALRALQPPAAGALVALSAALFQVAAIMGDSGFLAGLGIPLLLGATLYALGGFALLRPLLLPLAFLVLMVPPPGFIRDDLLVSLKLFVTEVSVFLLQAGGTTVLGSGNQIVLPEGTLFVADACSGLTSIVTMLPISCIVAYFLSRGVWRRIVVVASVIPLSIVGNLTRIVVTTHMASIYGLEFARGSLHESFGLATYLVGTLAVIGVSRVLR